MARKFPHIRDGHAHVGEEEERTSFTYSAKGNRFVADTAERVQGDIAATALHNLRHDSFGRHAAPPFSVQKASLVVVVWSGIH